MLREMPHVKQVPGDCVRRWFQDDYFDLYLWHDDAGAFVGFQLCYDRTFDEHAVTWLADRGYSHARVDDGEITPQASSSPMLRAAGETLPPAVARRFAEACENVPAEARERISQVLDEHAEVTDAR